MYNTKPLLIASSDYHLNPIAPKARRDEPNWWGTSLSYVSFVKQISDKYDIPVLIAGDLLDRWYFDKTQDKSKWNELVPLLKSFKNIVSILGQHEMQNNIIDTIDATAYKSLDLVLNCDISNKRWETDAYVVDGYPYGTDLSKIVCEPSDKIKIAMIHTLVWDKTSPFLGAPDSGNIKNLYNKLKSYSVVISGDNHSPFITQYKDTLFINCGSLMRLNASQIDYKPSITILFDDLSYKQIYIPIENDIISRSHIEEVKNRENRLECYTKFVVNAIKNKDAKGDIFESEINGYLKSKIIHKDTKTLLQETMDVINN